MSNKEILEEISTAIKFFVNDIINTNDINQMLQVQGQIRAMISLQKRIRETVNPENDLPDVPEPEANLTGVPKDDVLKKATEDNGETPKEPVKN